MARKLQVILEDDLDGTELGEDGETVTFGLDGTNYEIDLSHSNASALRDAFGKYMQHARKAGRVSSGHSTRRSATGGTHASSETKAARKWLIEQGILSAESRGRISQDNWDRYHQRHQQPLPEPTETAEASGTTETAETTSKPPRRNSKKADKAEAGTDASPSTEGLASLLP